MRTRFFSFAFLASVLAAACSGSAPSDLFSADGTSSDGGTTTADTSTGNGNGNGTTEDAGITPPPPVNDAATTPDANKVDSGPPGAITCGNTTCPLGQTCCANGERSPFTYVCKPDKGGCGDPSVIIQCDSAGDCATAAGNARICCGERVIDNGRTTYRDVTCRTSCNGTDVRFCDPSNPAASCGAQGRCGPSTILPGLNTCQ